MGWDGMGVRLGPGQARPAQVEAQRKGRESEVLVLVEKTKKEKRMGSGAGQRTGEFFRRRDEWRKHPMLTNQLRHATPGLGIALVAFGIYLVGEQVYNRVNSPSSHSATATATATSSHASSH